MNMKTTKNNGARNIRTNKDNLLYYDNILFGGIYDNRLLVKCVKGNKKYNLTEQIPYEGAKKMYQIEDIENKEMNKEIILETYKELPRKISR